ncbi:MAG TPA: haloacid dehalogenase type II [Stellaceae bacterium]
MTTLAGTPRPQWLTFDCYGTLIQWDEGLLAAVGRILARRGGGTGSGAGAVDPRTLIEVYDRHEHRLEQTPPHRSFREVAGEGLRTAMAELGLGCDDGDVEILTSSISAMPPFPEVVGALAALKGAGFRLCIVSNTDDAIIAGNVAQLGGHVDRVVTAEQARAYKPSRQIFEHAHRTLGVTKDEVVHICASPHLDLTAARDIGFRCVWIDRGTGRKGLADYTPDAVLPALDRVPVLFREIGWM